jgi:hypothetical protein
MAHQKTGTMKQKTLMSFFSAPKASAPKPRLGAATPARIAKDTPPTSDLDLDVHMVNAEEEGAEDDEPATKVRFLYLICAFRWYSIASRFNV